MNQPATHRMIVQAQQLFTTVVQKSNQGLCRNMGVICFGLTFWFILSEVEGCVNLSRISGGQKNE
jgi:hypothetical protein